MGSCVWRPGASKSIEDRELGQPHEGPILHTFTKWLITSVTSDELFDVQIWVTMVRDEREG